MLSRIIERTKVRRKRSLIDRKIPVHKKLS